MIDSLGWERCIELCSLRVPWVFCFGMGTLVELAGLRVHGWFCFGNVWHGMGIALCI
jgi:hypothetical protein